MRFTLALAMLGLFGASVLAGPRYAHIEEAIDALTPQTLVDEMAFAERLKNLLAVLNSVAAVNARSEAFNTQVEGLIAAQGSVLKPRFRHYFFDLVDDVLERKGSYSNEQLGEICAALHFNQTECTANLVAFFRNAAAVKAAKFAVGQINNEDTLNGVTVLGNKFFAVARALHTPLYMGTGSNMRESTQSVQKLGTNKINLAWALREFLDHEMFNVNPPQPLSHAELSATASRSTVSRSEALNGPVGSAGTSDGRTGGLSVGYIALIAAAAVVAFAALAAGLFAMRKRKRSRKLVPLYTESTAIPVA